LLAAGAGGCPPSAVAVGAFLRRFLVCVRSRGVVARCPRVVALPPAVLSALLPAAPGGGPGVVAVAGSRSAPPAVLSAAGAAGAALAAAGFRVAVGCAVGVDAAVLSAAPGPSLSVFAAFGPVSPPGRVAPGAWSGSAVTAVARALRAGAAVSWWSGGGPSVSLRARLGARTAAVVGAGSAGALAFFGSPASSPGSLLFCRLAAARGLPLFCFSPTGAPPMVGAGAWRPLAGALSWFAWVPGQGSLF
jgi:hypothetical protein